MEKFEYINKVLEKPLDSSQFRVCCSSENTVVAAGAGSGKTQVLATRYAWLLMTYDDLKVEEILALTFTKKAASEIYQRIYQILGRFVTSENTPLEEKKRALRALENFSKSRIQTLDSYSATIVRQAANKYGIRPDFESGDDGREKIRKLALAFFMKHKDDDALRSIISIRKFDAFVEDFFVNTIVSCTTVASESGYFEKKLLNQRKKISEIWNYLVDKTQAPFGVNDFEKELLGLKEIFSMLNYNGNLPETESLKIDVLNDELETDYPSVKGKIEKYLEVFENINLEKPIKGMNRYLKDGEYFTDKKIAEGKIYSTGYYLKSICEYIRNYESIKKVTVILDKFLDEVNDMKRREGILSFADVNALALRILKEQKSIRVQEKKSCKKIMIDEFQDNNGANRDLLYLLSEKDDAYTEYDGNEKKFFENLVKNLSLEKLFFVGDEKQSIYKFRGADVSVFNSLTKDLLKVRGQAVADSSESDVKIFMTNNYRTEDERLLKVFNVLFRKIFGTEDEGIPFESYYLRDATYHDMEADVNLSLQNVPAHVCLFDKNSIEEDAALKKVLPEDYYGEEDVIAYNIAKKIREHHDSHGEKYGAYAVLEKSRSSRDSLLKWFGYFGIPYNLDAQAKIFSNAFVNDVYYFLRLCIYPSDTIAFATFLTSPFAGLSVQTVKLLFSIVKKHKDYKCFYEKEALLAEIDSSIKEFSESEYEKYDRARKLYHENVDKILTQNLTDTIDFLWNDMGYRYETLLDEKTASLSEQYDLMFELAHSVDVDGHNVSWFVDNLASIKKSESFFNSSDGDINAKDISYPLERPDAVEVMTIHKSKGLQFKYVFVKGCTSKGNLAEGSDFYFSDEYGVSFKLNDRDNYFSKSQKSLLTKMEDAEFKRIVYVAITRAEKEVFVFGKITTSAYETCLSKAIQEFYGDIKESREFGKTKYNEGAPFDYTALEPMLIDDYENAKPCVPFDAVMNAEVSDEANACMNQKNREIDYDSRRDDVFKKMSFQGIEVLKNETDVLQNRISPSDLEKIHNGEFICKINKKKAMFPEIEEILGEDKDADSDEKDEDSLEERKNMLFDKKTLGIMVHEYLEKAILFGIENVKMEENPFYKKDLSDSDYAKICQICHDMVMLFMEKSNIIEIKEKSTFFRTEYPFKLYESPYFVKGKLDLVYDDAEGNVTIIDYKVDADIKPELYVEQQSCYYDAVKEILSVPDGKISVKLYYLRHGEFIDITDKVRETGEICMKIQEIW